MHTLGKGGRHGLHRTQRKPIEGKGVTCLNARSSNYSETSRQQQQCGLAAPTAFQSLDGDPSSRRSTSARIPAASSTCSTAPMHSMDFRVRARKKTCSDFNWLGVGIVQLYLGTQVQEQRRRQGVLHKVQSKQGHGHLRGNGVWRPVIHEDETNNLEVRDTQTYTQTRELLTTKDARKSHAAGRGMDRSHARLPGAYMSTHAPASRWPTRLPPCKPPRLG